MLLRHLVKVQIGTHGCRFVPLVLKQNGGKKKQFTSSHSAPWNTTRPSHSLHFDGALSFLSLWVWAALDIWVFLKGPGELAVSIIISLTPTEGRERKHKPNVTKSPLLSSCIDDRKYFEIPGFTLTHRYHRVKEALYHPGHQQTTWCQLRGFWVISSWSLLSSKAGYTSKSTSPPLDCSTFFCHLMWTTVQWWTTESRTGATAPDLKCQEKRRGRLHVGDNAITSIGMLVIHTPIDFPLSTIGSILIMWVTF